MKCPVEVLRMVVNRQIGEDALELVELLKKKGEMSEFIIAKALKEDINSVRNKIYRLQKFNLVKYTKKKDAEKGWYVYFWSIMPEKFMHIYKTFMNDEIKKLEEKINSKKDKEFFTCKNQCTIIDYEDGPNSNYMCPECGEPLVLYDAKKEIELMKKDIESLKKSMDNYV